MSTANDGKQVSVRLGGDEAIVRQMLDLISQVADVGEVSRPFPRREGGVHLHVHAVVPRPRAGDPGS